MEIVKIILVALICALISLYLKKYTPETAVLATIAGGLIIFFLIADYLFDIADYMRDFFSTSGIDSELLKIIIKVTVVAYVIEFAAGAVRDLGENSLSEKVILAGKIAVLALSFPIIKSLFSIIVNIVNG